MPRFELFGSEGCPYTAQMGEWLEFRLCDFVEYDVEADAAARARMSGLAPQQRMVPVLVEDGKVVQVGWHGRGCMIGSAGAGGGSHA